MKSPVAIIKERIEAYKFIIEQIGCGNIQYDEKDKEQSITKLNYIISEMEELLSDVETQCQSLDEAYEEDLASIADRELLEAE